MAHKTLVGGTAYEIKGGKCLVSGTGYSIKKGRTLVGGTGYDINFAKNIPASDLSVGSVVKLMESGVAVEYLVVNKGKPSGTDAYGLNTSYDDSCDGLWLLRKNIYERRAWHSQRSNDYKSSDVHTYLNSTFLNRFDAVTKSHIKTVKIPYVNGTGTSGSVASGASGLSTRVFLLSCYEVGRSQGQNQYHPIDGARLSYFSTQLTDTKRIGYLNGAASTWWLRSAYTQSAESVVHVTREGSLSYSNPTTSNSYGVRPTLVLPNSALFDEETLVFSGVA